MLGNIEDLEIFFTQTIPPQLRRPVLEAITTKKMLSRKYVAFANGEGCPLVVAAAAAANESIREFVKGEGAFVQKIALTLRVPAESVKAVYLTWDELPRRRQMEFISLMKERLAQLDYAEIPMLGELPEPV